MCSRFCIFMTHMAPRRGGVHRGHVSLEMISSVNRTQIVFPKESFNFFGEMIHSNSKMNLLGMGVILSHQIIHKRFNSKHGGRV